MNTHKVNTKYTLTDQANCPEPQDMATALGLQRVEVGHYKRKRKDTYTVTNYYAVHTAQMLGSQ